MYGNFSEESLSKYQEFLGYLDNPTLTNEEGTYDFTRCLRPNGTAFGTRGTCQAPNRVAPQQDVSAINQKDFLAGGGLTAIQKGASSTQVVNRGRDARARAFESGGGTAAMSKRGLSRDQVIQEGARSRDRAFKAGGGKASGKSAEETIRQGSQSMAKAYKAGGGEAASRQGERISDTIAKGSASLKAAYEAGGGKRKFDTTPEGFGKTDVIALGKKNLKEAFKAGGGEAARAQGLSDKEIIDRGSRSLREAFKAGGGEAARGRAKDTKEVIEKGKAALKEAAAAGGGNVAKGKEVLRNLPTERSLFSAGGGDAALQRRVKAMEGSLGRKLSEGEKAMAKRRVEDSGRRSLGNFFSMGGGRKAVASGKTPEEVMAIGEKIVADRNKKAKEERARRTQERIDRDSQFV